MNYLFNILILTSGILVFLTLSLEAYGPDILRKFLKTKEVIKPVFIVHVIGTSLVLSYLIFTNLFGWGIQSENQISYIGSKAKRTCIDGTINCPKSHRSYYNRRSIYGGGRRYGK